MSDIDIPPGTLMRTLTGHTSGVYTVIQLRDDDRLVSGSGDNTLRIWDYWHVCEDIDWSYELGEHCDPIKR